MGPSWASSLLCGCGLRRRMAVSQGDAEQAQRLAELPMEAVNDRLRLVAARFAFAFGVVVAFAIGSFFGPFLALDWPPLLRQMLLGYLVAFLITRIALVVCDFLLAPNAERFRIVPTDRVAARFWCRRFTVFVGWFIFGLTTVDVLIDLGFSLAGRQLVAYVLGLGLLAIALVVSRRPVALDPETEVPSAKGLRLGRGAQNALLSIEFVLLWGLWVARAMPAFWLLLVTRPAAGQLRDPARRRPLASAARCAAGW